MKGEAPAEPRAPEPRAARPANIFGIAQRSVATAALAMAFVATWYNHWLYLPTYNTTPTAASPEPIMLTTINYTNGPKVNRRRSGGLNLEYKLVPNVIVALRSSFNHEDARIYNRQVQLIATRASLAPGSNGITMIALPTTNNTTRAAIAGATTMRSRM